MEGQKDDNTDDSSIKPVSSLRSLFEKKSKPPPPPQPSPSLDPSRGNLTIGQGQGELHSRGVSLDIPRTNLDHSSPYSQKNLSPTSGLQSRNGGYGSGSNTPRLRPMSMGPLATPPGITVNSPHSLGRYSQVSTPNLSPRASREDFRATRTSRPASPTSGYGKFKLPSRTGTPALESRQAPSLSPSVSTGFTLDPQKTSNSGRESPVRTAPSTSALPPPINRAGKPKSFGKGTLASSVRQVSDSLAPNTRSERDEERISPFSTPPSEHEELLNEDTSSAVPPPVPMDSKPRVPPTRPNRDSYFATSPFHYADQESNPRQARSEPPNWTQGLKLPNQRLIQDGALERRPSLPPRHEDNSGATPARSRSPRARRPPPPEPPVRRSMETSSAASAVQPTFDRGTARGSMDSLASSRTLVADINSRFAPPPRRTQTFSVNQNHAPPPPVRQSVDQPRRSSVYSRNGKNNPDSVDDSEDEEPDLPVGQHGAALVDYPDSSQANRRPPRFKRRPHDIATKYETKLLAICGEYVCTSGFITRAWSLLSGEQLMSITHGETTKITALAFKPATGVEEEGQRLWLGTNSGDLQEIDIPTQSLVISKINAHKGFPVVKIHRQASEMWSLASDGKLLIWPTGDDGLPSLALSPHVCQVPANPAFSIIVARQLWIAYDKEISIFELNSATRSADRVLPRPLVQPNVQAVTTGTMVTSQPDRIYFGHIDGKVTIYSTKDYSCLGMVNVSLYKISSLVGVGDYLWAGFSTGMVYVYDPTTYPWKVKKDWQAHDKTIAGIMVDRTSIWKLDRLQVASLGTDNVVRIWDGMLEEDWLEVDMQEHDADFCDFREVSTLIMTWNAGASKPNHLRHDQQDSNFFRDLLRSSPDAPDIVVFGFQELVDLEDKKVTARTLFKSKKKDNTDHEKMSHQYRAWKEHLQQSLDQHTPSREPYTLLQTSNLVGLFTCVFVKTSLRNQIRDLDAAQVKLGMGGRYGNKGALLIRFVLDDSSICLVNCHLAAGQRQSSHRNTDIAGIMESCVLKPTQDTTTRSEYFVSGGDGSMVLDHEICILNGDLNYRIDTMSRDNVIREVQAGNLTKLLERDQLLLSRKRNPGFRLRAFQEKEITFPPTYKYDVGTDRYDTSEKKRSPAWCDRILYRGIGRIKQTEYRRHEVRVSDHRPVSGVFKLRVKTISQQRRAEALGRSEQRFEDLKQRIAMDIKFDYLENVFGMTRQEAEHALKKKKKKQPRVEE